MFKLPVNASNAWYVVKLESGQCQILSSSEVAAMTDGFDEDDMPTMECWGPYATEDDAIAHRVGLIRSGRCKPA